MSRLFLGISIIRRRWFSVALVLMIGLFAVFAMLMLVPKTYEAAAHVLIVSESGGRDPSVSTIDLPFVASSTVVLARVADQLKLDVPLMRLKRAVKIRTNPRSSIMEISYRDDVADRAVAVTNAVADELSRYYEQISSSRANATVRKLDAAIGAVREQLRRINHELAVLSAEQPFLVSDKALEAVTARLDDLDLQRELSVAALVSDVADAKALSADRRHSSTVARHEMLQSDPFYRDVVESAARDGAELAAARTVYTQSNPMRRYLESKVRGERTMAGNEANSFLHSPDAFSPSLEQNRQSASKAAALIEGDRAKIAALDRVIFTERARLKNLPQSGVHYAWLRLQRDAAQADYLALSSHRTTAVASRAEALALGSVVVVDRAVRADTASVGVGRSTLAIVSLLFVFALALVVAVVVELLDPSLNRADQIERLYGAPLLAALSTSPQMERSSLTIASLRDL